MVAEGRWYAARFMELAAAMDPTHEEDLFAAAECFEAEHDLMWKIWELVGGNGCSDDHVRKLAEPAVRQRIAQIILLAKEKEQEAAGWIEQALHR
jgi:hypothetical protein